MKFTRWNILSKTPFFQEYVIICQGGWVVSFPALSHFCHMSFFGGGGWVLKEIWSMSLNNPFFFTPSLTNHSFSSTDIVLNQSPRLSSLKLLSLLSLNCLVLSTLKYMILFFFILFLLCSGPFLIKNFALILWQFLAYLILKNEINKTKGITSFATFYVRIYARGHP